MDVASVALIRASLCFDQHALWAVVVAHCAGVERGEAEVSLDAAKAANESVPTLCDRAKCECRDTIGCCQGAWHQHVHCTCLAMCTVGCFAATLAQAVVVLGLVLTFCRHVLMKL